MNHLAWGAVALFSVVGVSPEARGSCPTSPPPRIIDIDGVTPATVAAHEQALRTLVEELQVPNTVVFLGPDVHLDFSFASDEQLPVTFGACTALLSRAGPPFHPGTVGVAPVNLSSARSPRSTGPLVEYGPGRAAARQSLFRVDCRYEANDHVRIAGFRLFGPSMGQQETDEVGIKVVGCTDVEVSNMEIAGWGGAGVGVEDIEDGGRIDAPADVRVVGSYIHHNQHPRHWLDGHTAGYGVVVSKGAWADITANVFDQNRHAIASAGTFDGYDAVANLVLKGGGVHWDPFFGNVHTHQFDIHGSGHNGFGGRAGERALFAYNSFQYDADEAISIRGRPDDQVVIRNNVFVHDEVSDGAVNLDDAEGDIDIQTNNIADFDSYGRYGVCDFDGDGVDDLFLAAGQTWWFSSYGEFPWSYLATRIERLTDVRLGYFDADNRCDVLTENSAGEWVISSGGVGWWQSIGNFGTPLSQVAFGQFDPNRRDHRPGVTRRTTHAFRKSSRNSWQVTPLSSPSWQHVQSSALAMDKLRFGDFTGDGVTDVLAVQNGRWSISASARGAWQTLNPGLSDDVKTLFIADLDHNNIDDLIKLRRQVIGSQERFTWFVSYDGRTPWMELTRTTSPYLEGVTDLPYAGLAGRFGAAPGGGVLLIDRFRTGHFYSEAEIPFVGDPAWGPIFRY